MTIKRLVFLLTILAVLTMAARISVGSDTWWHLRAGEWILEHNRVPDTDPFSYSRIGAEWHYPGWVMQILLLGVYRAAGMAGLNLLTAAFVAGTFWVLWGVIGGHHFLKAFLIVLAAAASGVYWAARPYLITFFFTGLYLLVLEGERKCGETRDAERPRGNGAVPPGTLWALPVLMVVWANSHGGFAVGFILYGIYFVGLTAQARVWKLLQISWRDQAGQDENTWKGFWNRLEQHLKQGDHQALYPYARWRNFLLVGFLMTAAVILNPYGPEMLLYPFQTVGIDALGDYIAEWQSPNFHELRIQPFLVLLMLSYGAVGVSRRSIDVIDFCLILTFGSLSLAAVRNIALFALAAPVVIARHGVSRFPWLRKDADWLSSRAEERPAWTGRLNVLLFLIMIGASGYKISLVIPESQNRAYVRETFPVEAAAKIAEQGYPGRLFNSYNWGGYLIWALPDYPVFVDGRTDLYGDEVIDQWVQVVSGKPGWEDILDRWDVQLVLLEPNRPVIQLLSEEGWDLIYSDQISVLYAR